MDDVEVIEVIVPAEVQVVEVLVPSPIQVIEVAVPGVQGPRGPAGAAGVVFTQGSPAGVWIIAHNLGRYPLVTLYTVGGLLMMGGVLNLSANVCRIELDEPAAGTAILI